jgi:2'-5' RNA ligase
VRLFIAVWPPQDVIDLLSDLPRSEGSAVRWTSERHWHVTLEFLGEVANPDPVAAAIARLEGSEAAQAHLGPATGWFPGNRVLQIPVSGLEDLSARVERVTADTDVSAGRNRRPEGPFRGHLTLARVRGRERIRSSLLRTLAGYPVEAHWDVTTVSLIRSELHREGSRYSDLLTVGLSPKNLRELG